MLVSGFRNVPSSVSFQDLAHPFEHDISSLARFWTSERVDKMRIACSRSQRPAGSFDPWPELNYPVSID